MRFSSRANTGRLLGLVALALGVIVGPLVAPASTEAHAMSRVLAPPTPAHVVGALAVSADSITVRVRWPAVSNSLGAATGYRVTVKDSASGATWHTVTVTDTQLVHVVPRPAVGAPYVVRVEVVAERRGLTSAPAVAYARFETPDAAPPSPGPVQIDTLPSGLVQVGYAPGETGCDRPGWFGPLLEVRDDTAFVALPAPIDSMNSGACYGARLVVLAEGAWHAPGAAAPDSIPLQVYPPGSMLPAPPARRGALTGA
jgi:hypothetical protein